MSTQENRLLNAGFYVLDLPNGYHAVADPMDDEDGFYLECADRDELVSDAHESIFHD